jgi:hypothetical protein
VKIEVMKKLLILIIPFLIGVYSCQQTPVDLPKTDFTSAKDFAESLLPELVIIEANTDTTIEIVFDHAKITVHRYDWAMELRSKPVRIEARFYNRAIDMMLGGLPTVSDQELLSSEGSIEILFEIDNQVVSPKRYRPWFEGESGYSETMNLFAGQRSPQGFNWIEMVRNPGVPPADLPWGTLKATEGLSGFGYSGNIFNLEETLTSNSGFALINCDDFPNVPTARTSVQFNVENIPSAISGEIIGGLYFEDINGFLSVHLPNAEGELPEVVNVPTELNCKAIVIAIADETIYYGMNDLVTELDQVVTLSLQPVEELALAEILAVL